MQITPTANKVTTTAIHGFDVAPPQRIHRHDGFIDVTFGTLSITRVSEDTGSEDRAALRLSGTDHKGRPRSDDFVSDGLAMPGVPLIVELPRQIIEAIEEEYELSLAEFL